MIMVEPLKWLLSDAKAVDNVTGKIHDKKKNEYKGVRYYQANEAVRCYRILTTMWISTISTWRMGTGITEPFESR